MDTLSTDASAGAESELTEFRLDPVSGMVIGKPLKGIVTCARLIEVKLAQRDTERRHLR